MTKADMIDMILERMEGISRKDAALAVEAMLDTIKETLEYGEEVKISGFGKFTLRDKKARMGRNPKTNEEITISARRVLTFKPSKLLNDALNKDSSKDPSNAPLNDTDDESDEAYFVL